MRVSFLSSTLLIFISVCYAKNITIDDRDPAITYSTPVCPIISQCDTSKNWWLSTDLGNPPGYSNGTAHVSNAPGLSAQLTFQGSDIYLYTSRGPTGGTAFITVDTNTPVLVDNHNAFTQERVPTFHSGGLDPSKSHVITVTIGGNSSVEGYFEIDFFAIITPDDPTSSAATPTPSRSTQGTPLASQTSSSRSKHSAPIGAIVGGTLAGIVVLAMIAFIFYRYRYLFNRQPRDDPNPMLESTPNTLITTLNTPNFHTQAPTSPINPPEYNPYDYPQASQHAQPYGTSPSSQPLGDMTASSLTPGTSAYGNTPIRPSTKSSRS